MTHASALLTNEKGQGVSGFWSDRYCAINNLGICVISTVVRFES